MPLRAEIDALNERVYQTVNNGTYNVAGATTEADYERLGSCCGRRWPLRPELQPAGQDQRAAPDQLPEPVGYARDLYQHPAFGETTDFAAFGGLLAGPAPSFVNDAPWRIDVEPAQADWDAPHHRETLA